MTASAALRLGRRKHMSIHIERKILQTSGSATTATGTANDGPAAT